MSGSCSCLRYHGGTRLDGRRVENSSPGATESAMWTWQMRTERRQEGACPGTPFAPPDAGCAVGLRQPALRCYPPRVRRSRSDGSALGADTRPPTTQLRIQMDESIPTVTPTINANIGGDPHRVGDRLSRLKGDVVIQDPELGRRGEPDRHSTGRRLDDIRTIDQLDVPVNQPGSHEVRSADRTRRRGPPRQVGRWWY